MIRRALLLLGLVALWLTPVQAKAAGRAVLVVVTVVSQQYVGSRDHEPNEMYYGNFFKVRLRPEAYASDGGPGLGEFDAVLETNFDSLPKRLFVVVKSRASREVLAWDIVEELACIGPDADPVLDRDGLDAGTVTVRGRSPGQACFMADYTEGEKGQFGFAATVINAGPDRLRSVDEPTPTPVTFQMLLRSDASITDPDGQPIEVEAALVTTWKVPPRRLFVVIESVETRNLIFWTPAEEFVCVPPDVARAMGRRPSDAGAVTISKGSPYERCFLL